ncbi:ABC transporter substrate-binding protein [Rugosimonospora acidiphila]|uniref:ABC transporter substrate-binding protein n=1 Tax=Rugosimonospora acidiphila TaxID=556531 RepID=A0ABP9SBF7_9ACTN
MRKALAAAIPLLLLGGIAGCGAGSSDNSTASNAPVTIQFWNTFTGPLETELGSLVKDFESSHPNIKVKLVYQPYDSMLQALQTSVAAKKPPAIAQLELTQMGQLATDGALAPISDLLSANDAKAVQKSIIPAIATANSYQGKLYTVPLGYNSNVLYYNKDLLAQAGISPQDMPKTWAQLEQDSQKLAKDTNGDGKTDTFGYAFPAQAPWILEVRLWQSGAQLFNDANNKALFDSPQAVNTFKQYQDLLNTKSAEMVQTDSSLDQLTDLFAAGKVAMFEQSSTAVQAITSAAKFDVGEAQFPTMGKQVYSLGGYNLGVFNGAPPAQQKAAAELMKWWTSPDVAAKWTSVSNYMPGIQAAWNTDTLKQWQSADPRRAVAAAQMPYTRSRPNLPNYNEIADDLADAFESTMRGQGTPQANLTKAVGQAKDVISESN